MKKIGKIKKTGLAFTALSVSAALLGGGLVCSMPYRASADNVPSAKAATVSPLFDGLTVPTEADYGDTIKIPAGDKEIKIVAPDGVAVELGTATDGYYSVKADQIGNYTVKYYDSADENAAYSFNINVSLKEDYFLKVDNNGADIPTRIQKGKSFKLPSAHVGYYDENKILRYYPSDNVKWTITDSLGGKYDSFGTDVTVNNTGKLYLTYSAQLENGKKFFSQTYTVNVQANDIKDSQAPSLTVSGITSNVSVRRAVTLPTATVSDDYDENPLVEITVTDPSGNPVKVVDIDRYGYAYQDADKIAEDDQYLATDAAGDVNLNYPAVAFDNKDVMTFYPLVAGQYKVKYVAKDDAGNVSSSKSWTMTAGDSVAPVFEEIDDWKIPAKWGVNVTNAEKDLEAEEKAIEIPIPFLVDNKDHMPGSVEIEEGKEDKDIVSLYVRITDSDYSRDILTFTNVLAKPAEGENAKADCNASNSVYDDGAQQTFSYFTNDTTPFKFDFSKYDRKDKDGEKVDLAGTYTVYYRASDAAGNRSTKQYTIELSADYKDENAPVIEEINLPKYISSADTTFNIPSVIASDAESTTVHTEYKIYSDHGLEDEDLYITVKGGEKAEIVEDEEGKLSLVIDKDKPYAKTLKLGDNIYFCVKATDAVGNVTTNLEATDIEDADAYKTSKDVVTVISKSTASNYNYSDAIAFTDSDGTALTNGEVGEKVIAGNFEIGTTKDLRKYTGFEVSVINAADGSAVETQLETFTAYDETTATIYVKNIQFTPTKAGDHYLIVRVFDVNNKNSVYSYKLTVNGKESDENPVKPSAAVVPDGSTGSVNVKYTLRDTNDKFAGAEKGKSYYHAYKIRGSVYSLMGNEFTAKAQSSYAVTNGFVEEDAAGAYAGYEFLPDGANGGSYSFSVTDNEKPVIEIQGIMPTYAEKNAEVIIPSIVAYSANGAANVEIEVTLSGDKIKTEKVVVKGEGDVETETNEYKFVGTKDGVYTIKVKAYRAGSDADATYTVNIGDVIAPEFTVSGGTSGRKTQGDEFTYGTIKLADETEKNVQITKTIYDPSGAEVSGATVSGSYTSYKDKTNNGSTITLDKSGTYKIVYTVKDSVGNEDPHIEYVTVSATGSSTPTTFTTLSTVLIIIAVVLLAGVIIYVVRFRKVKK